MEEIIDQRDVLQEQKMLPGRRQGLKTGAE
jgi:hypothetical protein